jgi:pilus assembly protein CpaC
MNMRMTLLRCCCFAVITAFSISTTVYGFQAPLGPQFEVNRSVDSIELIAGSSQRLKFDYNVPELMVENPDVISATPVAPNEILITGIKPGISTVTVSDPDKNLQMITVEVTIDVRKLERAIVAHFPDSQIKVNALKTGVILKGHVARADQVQNILAVARDYFPTVVINELQVNGTQNIAIKVKVYEVSRTKLRQLGVDWSYLSDDFSIVSSVADLIQEVSTGGVGASGQNLSFGVLNDSNSFNAFIQALEKNNLAKLLDQPVLVAQNGRPAEFLSGGEVPIQVASGLGTNSIEFRPFGTKLDLVPIVHGAGQLTLEVRAEVSEIANDLSGDSGVPGFRVRRVNTGVKMKAGHTLALAGDYREKVQTQIRGIPYLMDSPIFGPMFRQVTEERNETELVFLITPRFISEVESNRLPQFGPGQLTDPPSDHELYINGYTEVPRCSDDCPVNDRFDDPKAPTFSNLMPAYTNPNGLGKQAPAGTNSHDQPALVTPTFDSAYGFPQSGSSLRTEAPAAKQSKIRSPWPLKSRRR